MLCVMCYAVYVSVNMVRGSVSEVSIGLCVYCVHTYIHTYYIYPNIYAYIYTYLVSSLISPRNTCSKPEESFFALPINVLEKG
jgi:hypothetical protein